MYHYILKCCVYECCMCTIVIYTCTRAPLFSVYHCRTLVPVNQSVFYFMSVHTEVRLDQEKNKRYCLYQSCLSEYYRCLCLPLSYASSMGTSVVRVPSFYLWRYCAPMLSVHHHSLCAPLSSVCTIVVCVPSFFICTSIVSVHRCCLCTIILYVHLYR